MTLRSMGRTLALAASLGLAAGCADLGVTKEQVGTLLGGAGGAVAGAQFGKGTGQLAMTALGALLGAGLGNAAGASLDRADAAYHAAALEGALEHPGQTRVWHNRANGSRGSVRAAPRDDRDPDGGACREYQQSITVGGRSERAFGTACRQADGTWRIAA